MNQVLPDMLDALLAGFGTRAGSWLVLLTLAVAAFLLAAGVFGLHLLGLLLTGGWRLVHVLFRALELHLLGLMMALLGAWCVLTAAFSLLDGPYAHWRESGAVGLLVSAVHLAGTVLWAVVGLMAFRFAVLLVVRAYRPASAYA